MPAALSKNKLLPVLFSLFLFINAQAQNMHWGSVPGLTVNNSINNFLVDSTDTTLYVVGYFDTVNGIKSRCLAHLDRNLQKIPL